MQGDPVAKDFEFADVVAFLTVWVDTGVVVIDAEIVKLGASSRSRYQTITRMERPTATTAFFLPRRRAMRR